MTNLIKNKYFRTIAHVVVIVFMSYWNSKLIVTWMNKSLFVDFSMNTDMTVNDSFFNGITLIFLISIVIYAILGTLIVSILVTDLLFGLLILANNIKATERNEFITFSELQTITSPRELLSFAEISVTSAVFIVVSVIFGLFILHYVSKKVLKKIHLRPNKYARISLFLISFALLTAIYLNPNLYNERVLNFEESDLHNWNPLQRAQKDGYLPSFIHTVNPKYMVKPIKYDRAGIDDVYEKYTNISREINQNRGQSLNESQTILYLSESLMDPKKLPDLLLNETPIPFITETAENNVGGTMYSQYIGGGTANIEWSILTSFSLEVFSDPVAITPYSDFYTDSKNHHTILSLYNDKEKVAIHPYTAHLYKRKSVYDAVGFDQFLYLNHGIKHTDKLGTHSRVSDAALNKDISGFVGKDHVGLLHVLTMQNHSPYNGEIPDMDYKPDVNTDVYPEVKKQNLVNYLQALRASDHAVKSLMEEVDGAERDINFLFYGDHFPSLFRGTEEQFTTKELHETPWFIYMNKGRSENGNQFEGLSPAFFMPVLLKEGNYKVTPFQGLMNELLTEGVRRIGDDYIITEDGQVNDDHLPSQLRALVNDYRMVMYDALFGKDWMPDKFYTSD